MNCPKCGQEMIDVKDYCVNCGKKLKKGCKCWVKKQDNYDCGKDSCPGYGLFLQESKSKR